MAFQLECSLPWKIQRVKIQTGKSDILIEETEELKKCRIHLQLPRYATNITEMVCKPVLLYKRLSLKFKPTQYLQSTKTNTIKFDAKIDDHPGKFSFYPFPDSYICKYSKTAQNPWFVPPIRIYREHPRDYDTIGFFAPIAEEYEYCLRCYRLGHLSRNCAENYRKTKIFKELTPFLDDEMIKSAMAQIVQPPIVDKILFRFTDGITLVLPHVVRIRSPQGCPVLAKTWNTGLHNYDLARAGEDLRQYLQLPPRAITQLVREPENREDSEWITYTTRRNYRHKSGHCSTPHRSLDAGLGIKNPKQLDNEFEAHLQNLEEYQQFVRPLLEATPGTHTTSSTSALDMHDALEKHRRAGMTIPRKTKRRAETLKKHNDIDSLFALRHWTPNNLPVSASADSTTGPIPSLLDGGAFSTANASAPSGSERRRKIPLQSTTHIMKEYRVILTTDQRDELFMRPCGIHVKKIADTTLDDHFFTGKSAEQEQLEEFTTWRNTSNATATCTVTSQQPQKNTAPQQYPLLPPPIQAQVQEAVTLDTPKYNQITVNWENPPQEKYTGLLQISPPFVEMYRNNMNALLPPQPKLRAIASTQVDFSTPLLIDTGTTQNIINAKVLTPTNTRDPLLSATSSHKPDKFERIARDSSSSSEEEEAQDEGQNKQSENLLEIHSSDEYQSLMDQDYDTADV